MLVDVAVTTKSGVTSRKRCVAQPTTLQAQLLQCLKLTLPRHLEIRDIPPNVVTQIAPQRDVLSVNGGKIGRELRKLG